MSRHWRLNHSRMLTNDQPSSLLNLPLRLSCLPCPRPPHTQTLGTLLRLVWIHHWEAPLGGGVLYHTGVHDIRHVPSPRTPV